MVADEVRKLAERSSSSTEEIVQLISDTQKDAASAVQGMDRSAAAVDSGRLAMSKSSETFGEIVASVQKLMAKIEEVATFRRNSAFHEEVAFNPGTIKGRRNAAATEELKMLLCFYDELKSLSSTQLSKLS